VTATLQRQRRIPYALHAEQSRTRVRSSLKSYQHLHAVINLSRYLFSGNISTDLKIK
jgi:hypothetical protein